MKFSVKGLALASGIFWGVSLFLWTLLNAQGVEWGYSALDLFTEIYPGYDITVQGAFYGLVFGFVDGAIGGAIIAWLYNRFAK